MLTVGVDGKGREKETKMGRKTNDMVRTTDGLEAAGGDILSFAYMRAPAHMKFWVKPSGKSQWTAVLQLSSTV